MSSRTTPLMLLSVLSALLFSSLVLAQDDEEGEEAEEETAAEATPPVPEGPPTANGRTEATAVVGPRGMTFELHSKARVFIPAGLPTGAGRRITFSEVRSRVESSSVAEGFTRIGTLMNFDAALNATRSPVVISIRSPRDPGRPNRRLVLAMEQPTICREGLSPLEGAGGLCSGWELLDATYDPVEHRLSASMSTPGGHRLMFGSVPVAAPPTE